LAFLCIAPLRLLSLLCSLPSLCLERGANSGRVCAGYFLDQVVVQVAEQKAHGDVGHVQQQSGVLRNELDALQGVAARWKNLAVHQRGFGHRNSVDTDTACCKDIERLLKIVGLKLLFVPFL